MQDTTDPAFTQVPDDLTVECSQAGGTPASDPQIQAWRGVFAGADVCGSVTQTDDMPSFFPAGCAPGRATPVTVTLTDWCSLAARETRSVRVEDTTPPYWLFVPDDLRVECSAPGGTPASDPQIQAWRASFVSADVCDGAPQRDDMPPFFPAGCAPGTPTPVTVVAYDDCAQENPATRSVWVQDTTPPVIDGVDFDGSCLWPPNHKYVCIEDVPSHVTAHDVCDPAPRSRIGGCGSDQPDDAKDEDFPGENGDGHTVEDCAPSADGLTVCLRSERLGTEPAGRHYTPEVWVLDSCSNSVTALPVVYVPHDQSPAEKECLHPDSPGTK